MRKMLVLVATLFAISTAGRASPCVTGSLSSFESLGATGCTHNGAVLATFSGTLPGSILLDFSPPSFGDYGFTISVGDFSSLAGTSDTLNFSIDVPSGPKPFEFVAIPGAVTSGSATLAVTLSNGLSFTTTSTPGHSGGEIIRFGKEVGSLNVSATLTVAPGTTGPTSNFATLGASAAPEPSTVSLSIMGLLGLGLLYGRKMLRT